MRSHISCCFLNLYSHSELGLCDTKRSDQVIFRLKGRNGLYCPCFLPRKEPNVQLSIKKRLLRFGISLNLTTENSVGSYVYKKINGYGYRAKQICEIPGSLSLAVGLLI